LQLKFRSKPQNDAPVLIAAEPKNDNGLIALSTALTGSLDNTQKAFAIGNEQTLAVVNRLKTDVSQSITTLNNAVSDNLTAFKNTVSERLSENKIVVSERLAETKTDVSDRLKEIKGIVDEKLAEALNEKLELSMKAFTDNLSNVDKKLSEINVLSTELGKISNALTNVKMRGHIGEVQLENILEDILPGNYQKQFAIGRAVNDNRVVDFAVMLPGSNESERVYLPIDAKFPVEDYIRMQTAYDDFDKAAFAEARKNMSDCLLKQARSIRDKYISVPKTTDFAIMYLPTEGLYGAVLQIDGLVEKIQQECKVIIAGPSTVTAMLSTFRVGFKTVAITKNSKEVFKSLSDFEKLFKAFYQDLEDAARRTGMAGDKIRSVMDRNEKIVQNLTKLKQYAPQEIEE
jgi:DNA recombination protein RmuC